MNILGIESSCDDTAIGIVNERGDILANIKATHLEENLRYGGVVPEITARAHLNTIQQVLQEALTQSGLSISQIDGIAATCGPGLIGGVLVGAMMGKALSLKHNKPFYAVNHLEGHALMPTMTETLTFPYLLLLASGGHTQVLLVEGLGRYQLLGTTLDDALGECFDKVGKMMGLSYPAGPAIETLATKGDAQRFNLPRPLWKKPGCDFSFSGLKTAVRHAIEKITPLSDQDKADVAASFQHTVQVVLKERITSALKFAPHVSALVVSGGVAANKALRQTLEECAASNGIPFCAPPISLCTDNGVMIAWAGLQMAQAGKESALSFKPRPRWPLIDLAPALS